MSFIDSRTEVLQPTEIKKFISDHLPYRLKILDNVIAYPNKLNTDVFWPSIYESGQITCRMFIQFLGLGVNGQYPPELRNYKNYFSKDGKKSYKIKIEDLGMKFIELSELSENEKSLLAHAYEAGNIATAHLTFKTPFIADPNKVIQAAGIIRRILDNRLKK